MSDEKRRISEKAKELGFDAVGFAPADLPNEVKDDLDRFIAAGIHGDMTWLAERRHLRGDPRALWPAANSVICLAMSYSAEEPVLATLARKSCGNISVYARGRDYHDLVKKRLKSLAAWLTSAYGCEVKVFVDTAPVMEKPLAAESGLGWQGKHTNLLSRELGNWFFLGEIFTTLELPPDRPAENRCGTCRRCLDVCPTNAFAGPYRLDARRCISYLTIEHKGHIPREFRVAMGNRIYGCDDCLEICPWNKFARTARESALQAREDLIAPDLAALSRLDDAGFRSFFAGSPIKRTGRNRFVRNVMIAMGNSANPSFIPAVRALLADASPLVRAAAVWALARLSDRAEFESARDQYLPRERDAEVRLEWE